MLRKLLFPNRRTAARNDATPSPDPRQTDSTNQQLEHLNRDFLHFVREAQQHGSQRWQSQFGLSPEQNVLLRALSVAELDRLASCGVALFGASFHQPDVWLRLHDHSARRSTAERYAALTTRTEISVQHSCMSLFQGILFFGWHLAQQAPHAARLSLGMAADTVQVITRLDIWQCQFIACHHNNLLIPRWRHNRYFWSDLLSYGQSGDAQSLRFVRAMSAQLTAHELEPSAIARLTGEG
jgi:hypothetical protein